MTGNLGHRVGMRGAAAALVLLGALTLTACSDEDDPAGASDGTDGATATSPGTDETPDVDPTTQDSEETPDLEPSSEEPPPPASADACVHGSWLADNESIRELLEVPGVNVQEVTGSVVLTFREDGTSTTAYDAWTTVVAQDESVVTLTRNGEDLGAYTVAEDGTMTMEETEARSVADMVLKAEGQPAISATAPREEAPLSAGTFTCEGDTMTVTVEGYTSTLHRQ